MISVSKLPSAGLGNKLFAWASGLVFGTINNCPHYVVGMTKIHLGPILRGEFSYRFYRGYFKNELLYPPIKFFILKKVYLKQSDASLKCTNNCVYVFDEIPHWSDSFNTVRDFRKIVVEGFWGNLTTSVINRIELYKSPEIAVHVRMGDFRPLKEGENFAQVGAVRTPLSYFINTINSIRNFLGKEIPVTVFSDGNENDLAPLLSLPNIYKAHDDLDIVHLALLSKSKLIIMSAGSTFSFWAGFLSDAILINHFQHIHAPIRPDPVNSFIYEGPLEPGNNIEEIDLLKRNLYSYFG